MMVSLVIHEEFTGSTAAGAGDYCSPLPSLVGYNYVRARVRLWVLRCKYRLVRACRIENKEPMSPTGMETKTLEAAQVPAVALMQNVF